MTDPSDQTAAAVREAFDELARISLADQSLEQVMATIASLAQRIVPGADEVSITFLEQGRPSTVASTGALAYELDERQYERGYGPCLDGLTAGSVVEIPDMTAEDRWPDWARTAAELGARASLTVPVPLQRELGAALNMYSLRPHAFTEHSRELASTLAGYAGVALANTHLYEAKARVAEQLQEAMTSRAVIEQAKGILMGGRGCGADEAFDVLVSLSQASNRKLRDVAEALVRQASGG